jgi:hypothetical protein
LSRVRTLRKLFKGTTPLRASKPSYDQNNIVCALCHRTERET